MQNGRPKEAFVRSTKCRDLQADRSGTSRLAEYGDLLGVTTETSDVVMDPLQRHALVKQAKIQGLVGSGGCSSCTLLSRHIR